MDPQYSAQDIVRCDLCETPAPPMCCDICHINLCKACVGEHLSDRSTEHKVVPFEERGSTINYPKCQKHSLKTCEVHCKHCNIPICASCFSSGDHDQHEKIDILKILTRKKELIKKDLQELNNSICPKFQQAASKIPAQKAGVKQHSLKLTTALNKHGEALHKEINSLIQRKQSEIEEMDKQHLAAITKQEDVINKALHEIEQVILDLQKLLDSDDVCLVSEYTSKNEEFRSLPAQFQVTLPTFSPQKINIEQLYQQLGSLSQLLITFPLNDEAAGTTEVHGGLKKVSSPPARPLSDKPRIRTDIPTGCEPDDKAMTRSGGLVYSDYGDSSINLESTANDQRSVTIAPQVQEGLSATMKVAKVMEAGKPKKKNYNQNYVKLAGSNIVFYKDLRASKSQPGSPNGRPEFIVPLHGASVERHGKEKSKKSIKLTTSQGDQYILSYEDDYMLLTWLSNIDKTIISLGGSTDPAPPSPTQTLEPPMEKTVKKKPSFKTSATKDTIVRKGSSNEEGTLERGKLRNKLFNFIKSRPTKESLEQKGIIKDAVFGAHLRLLCEREKGKIPKFVQKCVVAIEKKGLDHDGIYRISGNLAQIQKLRCQVDQDHYNLDDECWDIHVLTGSLKLFFRELKEPLFTFNLFDRFIPALSREKNTDRLKAVRELINTLPKYNYETLKHLLAHLCKVVEQSKENRMQVHNVAIVFGPTLIWPETVTPNLAANMIYQSRIVEYCLLEFKNIFR